MNWLTVVHMAWASLYTFITEPEAWQQGEAIHDWIGPSNLTADSGSKATKLPSIVQEECKLLGL